MTFTFEDTSIIDKCIENAQKTLKNFNTIRENILSSSELECRGNCHGRGCGHRTKLKDITYIATNYYISPYGCTGGDYWNEGEGNWICPNCNHRNRLIDEDTKLLCEYSYRKLFRDTKEEYNDR